MTNDLFPCYPLRSLHQPRSCRRVTHSVCRLCHNWATHLPRCWPLRPKLRSSKTPSHARVRAYTVYLCIARAFLFGMRVMRDACEVVRANASQNSYLRGFTRGLNVSVLPSITCLRACSGKWVLFRLCVCCVCVMYPSSPHLQRKCTLARRARLKQPLQAC